MSEGIKENSQSYTDSLLQEILNLQYQLKIMTQKYEFAKRISDKFINGDIFSCAGENKKEELERQLDIITGKYEVARGIADKLIKSEIIGCNMGNGCEKCTNKTYCQFLSIKSELAELDK